MSDRTTVHHTILAILTLPPPRATAVAWHDWICAHTPATPCAEGKPGAKQCVPDEVRKIVYEYEAQANEYGQTLHNPRLLRALPAEVLATLAKRTP